MTGQWTDRQMKLTDFCDCAIEFLKRNLKRFIPVMLIYAAFMAVYSYFIKSILNFESVSDMEETGYFVWKELLFTLLALTCSAIAVIIAALAEGMLVYYTYTKLVTGQEPERRYTFKRGMIYALFSRLWSFILVYIIYIVILIIVAITGFTALSGANLVLVLLLVFLPLSLLVLCLYSRISLAAPLMIARNRNIFACLKESWLFTKKKTFRTLLLLVFMTVLSNEISTVLATVTALGLLESSLATSVLSAVVTGLSSCASFIQPVILTFYIVYEDTRSGQLSAETEINAFLSERESDET